MSSSRKTLLDMIDKLRVVGIFGPLGSGKTLLATSLAFLLQKHIGGRIYANYYIEGAEYVRYPADVVRIEKGVLVLDEAYTWLDSRRGVSYSNIIISRILLACRKKDLILIWTSQYPIAVDIRIRYITRLWIECLGTYPSPEGLQVLVRASTRSWLLTAYGPKLKLTVPWSIAEKYDTKRVEPMGDNLLQLIVDLLNQGLSVEDATKIVKAQTGIPEELIKVIINSVFLGEDTVITLLNSLGFTTSEKAKEILKQLKPEVEDQPKNKKEAKYRELAMKAAIAAVGFYTEYLKAVYKMPERSARAAAFKAIAEILGIGESTLRKYKLNVRDILRKETKVAHANLQDNGSKTNKMPNNTSLQSRGTE